MSALSDLLLRVVADPNYQTKGATLTWEELDDNLKLLGDAIRELSNITPSGIDAYNPATEYKLGDLVTFSNNLWEYVYPTPSTGNAPGDGSEFWSIRSAGTLSHAQNTDTHTTSNRFGIGDNTNTSHKELFARIGADDGQEPRIRYNKDTGLWEISHDGVNFSGISNAGSIATGINTGGEIDLNMRGMRQMVFVTEDPIAANIGMDLSNGDNGVKASWLFEIQNLSKIIFSNNMLFSDARVNGIKEWAPFDNGIYKAEFTKYGVNWLVDINGPYV